MAPTRRRGQNDGASGDADPVVFRPPAPVDDRAAIRPGDTVLLVIDDDTNFTRILLDRGRKHGFKCVLAGDGETGLALARELKPHAITLDIKLPGMNGWAVLDRLKHDPAVRHIPVHILSVADDFQGALRLGAIGCTTKPTDEEAMAKMLGDLESFVRRRRRSLLVVEDDEHQLSSIIELVGGDGVDTVTARSGEQALEAMRARRFDCVVLDLGLPGMTGFEMLDQVREDRALAGVPVVVYTARDLTRAERDKMESVAEAVIVKGADSPERLLEETVLFLHRSEADLPPNKRAMLENARRNDPTLSTANVLIVDDDVRNVYALTAALEQRYGMHVAYADNGEAGIALLRDGNFDVVLMDVMMPGMDGYETIRRMRQMPGHNTVPIIALTAKAMKGDREKCLEAGASDYISKPVDVDQLASLMRVWVTEFKSDTARPSR